MDPRPETYDPPRKDLDEPPKRIRKKGRPVAPQPARLCVRDAGPALEKPVVMPGIAQVLAQAPLPDPSYLASFDALGVPAVLVGVLIVGFFLARWMLRQKDAEIAERDEVIAELRGADERKHRDLVRLTEEWKNMTLNLVGRIVGDRAGPNA